MANTTPIYRPLSVAKSEIRLLEISSLDNNIVSCKLNIVSLKDNPTFAALSYVWGDPRLVEDIILDGQVISVTRNLRDALRHIRTSWLRHFPDRDPSQFRLWADAVCINQQDVAERSSQVQQMCSIFESAEVVLAWLGTESFLPSRDSQGNLLQIGDAFAFFEQWSAAAPAEMSQPEPYTQGLLDLEWLRHCPGLLAGTADGEFDILFAAASAMFEMRYWRRAWIFQEVVLSRQLLLCTANRHCHFEHCLAAAGIFRRIRDAVESGEARKPDFVSDSSWAALRFYSTEFHRLGNLASARRRRLRQSSCDLVASTWGAELEATDPRDHIFALLAISRLSLTPRYDNGYPARAAYRDYAVALLEVFYASPAFCDVGFTALSFLDFAGIGILVNTLNLPTWAPNFPEFSANSYRCRYRARDCYNDDNDLFPSSACTGPRTRVDGYSLACQGIILDAVTYLGEAINDERDAFPEPSSLRPAVDFINRYLSRHTRCASGTHPLRALLCNLSGYVNDGAVDGNFLLSNMAFLCLLLHEAYQDPAFEDTELGRLCAKAPERFSRTKLGRLFLDYLAQILADRRINVKSWTADLVLDAFPEHISIALDFNNDSEDELPDDSGNNRIAPQIDDILVWAYLSTEGGRRLYETSRGFMGLALPRAAPGDVLCLLKGYPSPVLLRPVKDSNRYLFVGRTHVHGLMTRDEFAAAVSSGTVETLYID